MLAIAPSSPRPLHRWRRPASALLAAALALLATASPTFAQNKPNQAAGPSDAEVVAAMKKGIDFLLNAKQGDNWETGHAWPQGGQIGGETSIALYALLHAGQSLKDDQEYSTKLSQRALAGPIAYLSKLDPEETYTAGLQASALALTTKRNDDKPGEGTQNGLANARDYILLGMNATGGYWYSYPGENWNKTSFYDAWNEYFANKNQQTKQTFIDRCKGLTTSFGGPDIAINRLKLAIRNRLAKAKEAKDNAALNRAENEAREFEKIYPELPRSRTTADLAKSRLDAIKRLAETEAAVRAGGYHKDNDPRKEFIPKKPEELKNDLERARKSVVESEFQLKNNFNPWGDLSNSQYGTLGAWALADYGIEMPLAYWKVQDNFWRLLQHDDGSWSYSPDKTGDTKETMGVAGLASLFITREFLDLDLRLTSKPDKNIDLGLAWLNANFKPSWDLYYMYGVERVGLASGLKYFGTTDWYRAGAREVIKSQGQDGSWGYQGSNTVGTAYALLFLSRGRNPILFNKLQYPGPCWDARPRDSANLTRWIYKNADNPRPLNWQIVNLNTEPEDWLDAPILLITGSVDPKFTPADVAKLRAYIQAGGTIFSSNDGGKREFTDAIRKLAGQVVENKYEMRELPPTHVIFTNETWASVKNPPAMLGMSNGVRDFWFHSTVDMGASWQQQKFASHEHFEIPFNIYFYATGKGTLNSKLASLAIAQTSKKAARTIDLARIDHVGNADPEPGAWPRMARLAQSDFNTELKLTTVKWPALDPKKFKIAHMTGTTRFTLNDADTAALKAYLDAGGILFADAAGGSADFTESFLNLMKTLYPNDPPQPIMPEHPIIKGSMTDAESVATIKFRKFGDLKFGRRLTAPRLETYSTNGRISVIFSPYDLTSGLLGTNTWGILGYTPESSQDIVRNILLYAANPPAPPATAPTTAPAAK